MWYVAFFITVVAIASLLWLDRHEHLRNSGFLWLPVVWLAVVGSRPVSVWLAGSSATGMTVEGALDGNSTDAAAFGALLAAGLIVVLGRRRQAGALIRANPAIVLYFAYCLVTVVWSPFPVVASKRWMKAVGDLVMILVCKLDDLILDRGTVPRANPLNLPAVQRRSCNISPNNAVAFLAGPRDVTADLIVKLAHGAK